MTTAIDLYQPFDAGPGADVLESGWRMMARLWSIPGVDYSYANKFEVFADSTGPQAKVKTGRAWIDGYYAESTSEKTIPLNENTSGNPRIDRIVLQVDPTNNICEIAVVEGTPGVSPSIPSLTTSETGIYQIGLARVLLADSYTTVADADVTDEREIALGIDGAGGNRVLLYDNTLAAPATGWDVLKIPQCFRDLELSFVGHSASASADYLSLRFNAITSGSYDWADLTADSADNVVTNNNVNVSKGPCGALPWNAHVAAHVGSYTIRIENYLSALGKGWNWSGGWDDSDLIWVGNGRGALATTAVINRLTVLSYNGDNLNAGSRLSIVGVR